MPELQLKSHRFRQEREADWGRLERLLEGFARQLIKDDLIRWSIAIGSLVIWCAYFYLPRGARLGRR